MPIIPQLAFLLHTSVLPPAPLMLAAPPLRPRLAAPQIAGLLPPPREIEIVVERPFWRAEFLRQLGPIRSREVMQAEIRALCLDAAHAVGMTRQYSGAAAKGGRA